MNPQVPPVFTNLRQRIFDAVVEGFRSILTANNYETNVGANVFPWKSDALAESDLPGIVIRDVGVEPVDTSSGVCVAYRMRFEVALVPSRSVDSPAYARKIWADVITMLGLNRIWRDTERLNMTTEYAGDEMRVDEKAGTFSGIFIRFFVLFKMKSLDPYIATP